MNQAIWQDPRVTHYAAEGSFGYLHHEIRNEETDRLLDQFATELGYDADEFVGLLISKMGRWAADELIFENAKPRCRAFMAQSSTRSFCAESARAYELEMAEGAR